MNDKERRGYNLLLPWDSRFRIVEDDSRDFQWITKQPVKSETEGGYDDGKYKKAYESSYAPL